MLIPEEEICYESARSFVKHLPVHVGDIMRYITSIYSPAIILGFCIALFININQN